MNYSICLLWKFIMNKLSSKMKVKECANFNFYIVWIDKLGTILWPPSRRGTNGHSWIRFIKSLGTANFATALEYLPCCICYGHHIIIKHDYFKYCLVCNNCIYRLRGISEKFLKAIIIRRLIDNINEFDRWTEGEFKPD